MLGSGTSRHFREVRSMSGLRKVLLYSHDTYGLGHLRRNLAIARHLLSSVPGVQVVLASGSTVADRFELPEGLKLVELPPVMKTGKEQYRSREPGMDLSLVRRARTAVLADVVVRWQPDVLLVDHSPQGMKGELLGVFEAIRSSSRRTKVVLGLRDILDDPAHVRRIWSADGVYETLEQVYDKVLVYGEPGEFDVVAEYGLPPSVTERMIHCGYVASAPPSAPRRPGGLAEGARYILGTVGGGGDGAEVLIATLRVAGRLGLVPVVACGPLMPEPERVAVQALAASIPGAVAVEYFEDLARVALGAEAIVTRGGYNSQCELVPLGVPTVVVPRVWPRREQLMRARAFAARGLVEVVEPDGGQSLEDQLEAALEHAIAYPPRRSSTLDLGGLEKMRDALVEVTASDADVPMAARVPEPSLAMRA